MSLKREYDNVKIGDTYYSSSVINQWDFSDYTDYFTYSKKSKSTFGNDYNIFLFVVEEHIKTERGSTYKKVLKTDKNIEKIKELFK